MARGIRQNEVNQAADALVGAGERPTVERLRAKLGTGSPNTITRMLDVWWAELGARLTAAVAVAVPDAPDAVQRGFGGAWAQAVSAAREIATAELALRDAELRDREAAVAAAEAAADRDRVQALERGAAQDAQLVALRGDLAQERLRAAEAANGLAAALASSQQLQNHIKQLLATAERHEKQYRADLERADAQERRWIRELDALRQTHKAALSEIAALKTAVARETRRADLQLEQTRRANRLVEQTGDAFRQAVDQCDRAERQLAREKKPTRRRGVPGSHAQPVRKTARSAPPAPPKARRTATRRGV